MSRSTLARKLHSDAALPLATFGQRVKPCMCFRHTVTVVCEKRCAMFATILYWWVVFVVAGFVLAPLGAGLIGLYLMIAEQQWLGGRKM